MKSENVAGLGFLGGCIFATALFLIVLNDNDLANVADRENKIIKWEGQLYQMVPVEKKIEYVKPEEK